MLFRGVFFLFLFCSPLILAQVNDKPLMTSGSEFDDENSVSDEAVVEEADEKLKDSIVTDIVNNESEPDEATIVDGVPVGSKNVVTEVLFVKPAYLKRGSGAGLELPANKPVHLLVSFTNVETESQQQTNDYKLDYIEGFLRYPSDYSYYLQNFTVRPLNVIVEPQRQATIEYNFLTALQLAGRPFGLTLRIAYHNNAGKLFTSTFFNETVHIIEVEDGFDTESLFLYVLVTAVLCLMLFGAYHLVTVHGSRRLWKRGVSRPVPEQHRQNPVADSNIDLEWIPVEHLKIRQSPSITPRQRKSRRNDDNHVTGR